MRKSVQSKSVQSTPPAMRQTTVRSMLSLPHAPGQVGLPPTMNTKALLGFPRKAHRDAYNAMDPCEAEKFALARLVGTASRATLPHEWILRGGRTGATARAVNAPHMWPLRRCMHLANFIC